MVVDSKDKKPRKGVSPVKTGFPRIKENKGRYLGAAIVFFIILFAVAYGLNTQ